MASLPSKHPTLSLHLTDVTLTPLITSSSSQSHLESLTSLTTSAINCQSAVQRANLGRPQRIMVEYPDRGAVVLHSFLDPREQSLSPQRQAPSSPAAGDEPQRHGDNGESDDADQGTQNARATRHDDAASKAEDEAPTLIGVVVAGTADEAREARRAAARLERIGREFQRKWAAEGPDRTTDDTS